jgi:hypothetical protein
VLLKSSADEFLKANQTVMIQKLVNKQFAMPYLLGERSNEYSRAITYAKKPSFMKKIRLFIFYLHLKIIRKINLVHRAVLLNNITLFYLKAVKTLKK